MSVHAFRNKRHVSKSSTNPRKRKNNEVPNATFRLLSPNGSSWVRGSALVNFGQPNHFGLESTESVRSEDEQILSHFPP